MDEFLSLEKINEMTAAVRAKTSYTPKIGMILGSGLGPLADTIENPDVVPYGELPGWPISTVEGHSGELVIGKLEGQDVLVMRGRTHFYEGYPMPLLGLPVRVMQSLGAKILIVTNAAGAVDPDFEPGDLMMLTDHLNLLGMAGHNPLRGPNLAEFGPRFPDMSQVYDRELHDVARKVAAENEITLREGVYVCLAGPSFETPADLRFLRTVGVDAVGMSTVPEAIVARHGGMRVLGVSGISNKANLDGNTLTTHEEVLEAGQVLVPKLTNLVRGVLRSL
ncbi:MAG: purine-nucleoside phosphorylase [Chloroflexi bacterium]|nr:MAG: purine-nucleoside phosphorylase [Chloroflexota bacterium]MBL1193382.1 purine-nucleoside phosphorylase [Chloroflexota bacterium]NOH10674.1 purine-nucleoside phosphorylase [Chloroflexota bacterium]